MPEFKYAKGGIADSLQFITGEIKEFEQDYSSKTLEDYQKDRKLQKLKKPLVLKLLMKISEQQKDESCS